MPEHYFIVIHVNIFAPLISFLFLDGFWSLCTARSQHSHSECYLYSSRTAIPCKAYVCRLCIYYLIDGWGSDTYQFGSDNSTKSRLLTFITSVRTVMRGKIFLITYQILFSPPHRCKYASYCIRINHGLAFLAMLYLQFLIIS